MKNDIIDSVDFLSAQTSAEDIWASTIELTKLHGVKSVSISEINTQNNDVKWARTNFDPDWMEEYLSEGYLDVDPLLNDLSKRTGTSFFQSGQIQKNMAPSRRTWALDNGLVSSGYNTIVCSRFGNKDGLGKFVSLTYDRYNQHANQPSGFELALSAIVAAHVQNDDPNFTKDLFPKPVQILSERQREVLSLLAEGHLTGRIAERLGISNAAVTHHFQQARLALGASTREQALAIALKQNLISL